MKQNGRNKHMEYPKSYFGGGVFQRLNSATAEQKKNAFPQ